RLFTKPGPNPEILEMSIFGPLTGFRPDGTGTRGFVSAHPLRLLLGIHGVIGFSSPRRRSAWRKNDDNFGIGNRSRRSASPLPSREDVMLYRSSIGAITLATALGLSGANAFDESQYPDWSGQWQRPVGVGFQWDPSKPMGRGQQAPLTAEYQAVFEASLADQAAGGQGGDLLYTCLPVGMPRVMTGTWPFEFVVLPKITYLNFETNMPRRIYTDGRSFPTDEEPSFMGYSI